MKVDEGKQTLTEILEMIIKDPSIYKEDKAKIIIHATSLICGIVAVQPLPFADIFVLTPIQVVMVTYLNRIKGNPYKKSEPKEILSSLLGVVGWGTLAQHAILGLYKTVLPFMGAVTTIPLVYAATFALGKCAETLIEAKSKDQNISQEELKKIVEETKKKAETEHTKMTVSDAMNMLGNLKKNTQEYKEYVEYVKEHDLSHLLENDIMDEMDEFFYAKNDVYDMCRRKMEYLEKRIKSKYPDIQISERALSVIALLPSDVMLEKIEAVISQLHFDVSKISNAETKILDGKTLIEITEEFGKMQVFVREDGYDIHKIEPAGKYRKNDIWKVIMDTEDDEKVLYDEEIRKKFYEMISHAKHEILIVSPWVSYRVTKHVLPILKKAAGRGVKIKIVYGIEGMGNSQGSNREENSDKQILEYRSALGSALKVRKDNTHVKICICDDAYLIGSYNFLSFDGEYITDTRHEVCLYKKNAAMIRKFKNQYFTQM